MMLKPLKPECDVCGYRIGDEPFCESYTTGQCVVRCQNCWTKKDIKADEPTVVSGGAMNYDARRSL